jgi:acetoin utilization deacetylase AcuC-like enzyme
MLKYELIPAQLLYEGTCSKAQFFAPEICKESIITLTHDSNYYKKLTNQQLSTFEQRVIGFPQSPALIQRELTITQGTIDACNFALELELNSSLRTAYFASSAATSAAVMLGLDSAR